MSETQIIHSQYLSLYKWFFEQKQNDVIVKLKMPSKFNSSDIQIELKNNQEIRVFIAEEIPFLYGILFDEVEANYQTSVLSDYFILTLHKKQDIEWKCLIKSVSSDKLTADPKSCFLLGIDQIDDFPNETLTPLLALSVQYHYPEACLYLGNKYLKEGNETDALESYQLIANEFNYPTAELQAGIILAKLGKTAESQEYLTRASKNGIHAADQVLKDIEEAKTIEATAIQAAASLTALTETAAELTSMENSSLKKAAANVIAATEAATLAGVAESVVSAAQATETAIEGIVERSVAVEEEAAETAAAGEAAIAVENIANIGSVAAQSVAAGEAALAAENIAGIGKVAAQTVAAGEAAIAAESIAGIGSVAAQNVAAGEAALAAESIAGIGSVAAQSVAAGEAALAAESIAAQNIAAGEAALAAENIAGIGSVAAQSVAAGEAALAAGVERAAAEGESALAIENVANIGRVAAEEAAAKEEADEIGDAVANEAEQEAARTAQNTAIVPASKPFVLDAKKVVVIALISFASLFFLFRRMRKH